MKRALMSGLTLLISVVFAATVIAQAKPPEKPPAAPEKAVAPRKPGKAKEERKRFSGIVVSVDAAAKTFVAKDKKGEMTFNAASAKLAPGSTLEEIKAGDKIAVMYVVKDGKNVARAVAKPTPKKEKAQGAKPAEKPAEKAAPPEKK